MCSLPPIVGPCRASFPRWHHNATSKKCELFIYGGCSANANNFGKKFDCEKKCNVQKVDDICSLPKKPGLCLAYFKSWYYDSTSKTCREFVYGGCMGNANRFSSYKECSQTCGLDSGTISWFILYVLTLNYKAIFNIISTRILVRLQASSVGWVIRRLQIVYLSNFHSSS